MRGRQNRRPHKTKVCVSLPVVHFEIGCRALAATKDFYQKMFDWPINEQFQIAEAGIAGHLVSLGHEPQHYAIF